MKLKVTSILLILLSGVVISAQTPTDKTVTAIRRSYDTVSAQAKLVESDDEQGEIGPLVVNELTINSRAHQWRAVGIYRQTYRFFYKGGDDEKHMYPDQLVLVKRESVISAQTNIEEYFFDDAGNLIFHKQNYVNVDNGPTLREVFFVPKKDSLPKAVRIIENKKARDKFSPLDRDVIKDILKVSEKLKDTFDRSINM